MKLTERERSILEAMKAHYQEHAAVCESIMDSRRGSKAALMQREREMDLERADVLEKILKEIYE